jgi:hypothetical protein
VTYRQMLTDLSLAALLAAPTLALAYPVASSHAAALRAGLHSDRALYAADAMARPGERPLLG